MTAERLDSLGYVFFSEAQSWINEILSNMDEIMAMGKVGSDEHFEPLAGDINLFLDKVLGTCQTGKCKMGDSVPSLVVNCIKSQSSELERFSFLRDRFTAVSVDVFCKHPTIGGDFIPSRWNYLFQLHSHRIIFSNRVVAHVRDIASCKYTIAYTCASAMYVRTCVSSS